MEKTFKSLFFFTALALAFAGCQKNGTEPSNQEARYKYSFALIEEDTKAVIGDKSVEWEDGDRVGMFVGDYKGSADIDVTTTPKMVVLYSPSAIPAGTMAYAYAPYDEANIETDANHVKITVSSNQGGASVSAMPLAGVPFKVEEKVAAGNQNGNGAIKFMNLGSLVCFKIYSTVQEHLNENIESILFQATQPIAGVGYLDLTAMDMEDENSLKLQMSTSENTVKVFENEPVESSKEYARPLKMVVLPGSFGGVLTVTTNVATYVKEIPEREYIRSHSRTFSLDLATAKRTEVPAETFFYESFDKFAKGTGGNDGKWSGNIANYSLGSVTFDESGWTYENANAACYCVKIGRDDAGSIITRPIAVTGDAKLWFKAGGWETGTNELTVTATGATLHGDTEPTLTNGQWEDYYVNISNATGNVVLTFSGGRVFVDEIAVFNGFEPVNPATRLDPDLAYGDGTLSFIVLPEAEFTAPELTNPYDVPVSYSSSDEEIAKVDATTGEVLIGKKEGVAVITATFTGSIHYLAGSASYKIVVRGENSTITDVLNLAFTGLSSGSMFTSWSGKAGLSGAVYAGYSGGANASIQLNTDTKAGYSGIVSTKSGGKLKKVVLVWNSNTAKARVLNVYGSNTPYERSDDLFDEKTQGKLLGSFAYPAEDKAGYELTIDGDYEYIGLRSAGGAIYINEFSIIWK